MREIKFEFLYKGLPFSSENKQCNWFKKHYTLDQLTDKPLRKLSDVHDQAVLIAKRQYTGLKDSNGVEIYEGDIVCSPYVSKEFPVWINAATFVNGSWVLLNGDDFELMGDICSGVEVIGNIHQNPELLED